MKKPEWSKLFAAAIALGFGGVGLWSIYKYYQLCRLAIEDGSMVQPDSSVAVACVTTVIGSLVSYLLYQAGLKNSRNKFGVDADGQPYKQPTGLTDDDPEVAPTPGEPETQQSSDAPTRGAPDVENKEDL